MKNRFLFLMVLLCLGCLQAETPIILRNLKLNRQDTQVVAYPGEKLRGIVNMYCAVDDLDPHSLYQIVIGYKEFGAQKCIFHEYGYRCKKEAILSFYLDAPQKPGGYEVLCRIEQAGSKLEAMQNWEEASEMPVTIGRVFVTQ